MGSLRALTASFLLAFLAATVLTGYATFTASHRAVVALVDRRIAAIGDAVTEDIRPGDASAIAARIASLSRRRDTGDVGFALTDRRGRRLAGNVALSRHIPNGLSTLSTRDAIPGLSAGRALVRDVGGGYRLAIVAETEPIDGYAALRTRNYVLGFGSITLVVLGGTVLFGAMVRRRIGEVRAAAEAIIAGDMARRIPVAPRGGAFDRQAATFNRMLDRIATLMDHLRHVSSDVAHDLRTPLARLRSHLAVMTAAPVPPSREALECALDQCDTLLDLFAAILRIADVEGRNRDGFAPVDLAALVEQVGEAGAALAGEGGQRLKVEPGPALRIDGDRQLLAQALLNLVTNAVDHTPAGTTIRLSLARDGDLIEIRIRDDGPGIPRSAHATALRRFGRLDGSRHRAGHGLGLPLAFAIAKLHGGELTLDDAAPGLIVTIRLPAPAARNSSG